MPTGVITHESGRVLCRDVAIQFDMLDDGRRFGTFQVPPALTLDDFKERCMLEVIGETGRFTLLVSMISDNGTLAHFCAIRR